MFYSRTVTALQQPTPCATKMHTTRKRRQEAEEVEYHDFIYQVESSAKRILEKSAKQRIAQAKKARIDAIKERHGKSIRVEAENHAGNPFPASSSSTAALDDNIPDHITQLKTLTSTSAKSLNPSRRAPYRRKDRAGRSAGDTRRCAERAGRARASNAGSLPLLSKSPLRSRTGAHGGKSKAGANAWAVGGKSGVGSPVGLQQKLVNIHELRQGASKGSRVRIKKIAGHFAPGTVLPRPAHEVPRKLSVSAWLDPSKPVSIEKSLAPLSPSNELQGPTNWSSVDLRMKYRDEATREEAFQISQAQQQEAKELDLVTSTVVVTEHPVKTDFEKVLVAENTEALKTSQKRNRLKEFSYDFNKIWRVVGKRQSERKHSQSRQDIPVCNGIPNRRDPFAHEQDSPQVQSISQERALQGVNAHITPKPFTETRTSASSVQTTGNIRDKNFAGKLRHRFVLRVSSRGGKIKVVQDGKATGAEFFVLSVWQNVDGWRLEAYDPGHVITVKLDVAQDQMESLLEGAKRLLQIAHDQKQQLLDAMRIHHFHAASDRIQRAQSGLKALWWHTVDTTMSFKDQAVAFNLSRLAAADKSLAAELVERWRGNGDSPKVVFRRALRHESRHLLACVTVALTNVDDKEHAMPENVRLEDVAVLIHIRDAETMQTVYLQAYLGRALLRCMNVTVSSKMGIYLAWWLKSSDSRERALEALVEAYTEESFREHLAMIHDSHFESLLNDIESLITKQVETEWDAMKPSSTPAEDIDESTLWRTVVSLDESSGGVGLLERLKWADKLHALTEADTSPLRGSEASIESALHAASSHMIVRCRAKEAKLGEPVPSTSIRGLLQPVAAFFKKELNSQGDYPITCVLALALDTPLHTPCILLRHSQPLLPPRKEETVLSSAPSQKTTPGFIQRIVSSVDDREAPPIWVLTNAAHPIDYGDVGKPWERERRRDKHPTVRLSAEHNPTCFRVKITSDDLCHPEPEIFPTSFGVTQACVTPNSPATWPFRYTWHSDDLILEALSRQRTPADFKAIAERYATMGSNSPICVHLLLRHISLHAIRTATKQAVIRQLQEIKQKQTEDDQVQFAQDMLQSAESDLKEASEARAALQAEMHADSLRRSRKVRGRVPDETEWKTKLEAESTRKLGSWSGWQAYMWMDEAALFVLDQAKEELSNEQVKRVAAGEPKLTTEEVQKKLRRLAVREGTIFYYHEKNERFQWEQPAGWQGIAAEEAVGEIATLDEEEEVKKQKADEEATKVNEGYEPGEAEATNKMEHLRELRRIGKEMKAWMDDVPPTDLRVPFVDSDPEGHGVLRHEAFFVGLAKTGMDLDSAGQNVLIAHFDPKGLGFIDYRDFIQWSLDRAPHNRATWETLCLDLPELTPSQWEDMAAQAEKLTSVEHFDVFKDRNGTRQHFVMDNEQGVYSWRKPQALGEKERAMERHQELLWTQISASIAARSAAAFAKQAQTVSQTTVEDLAQHLAKSDEFVSSLLDRLGLKKSDLQDEEVVPAEESNVPPLDLRRADEAIEFPQDGSSESSCSDREHLSIFSVQERKKASKWNLIQPEIEKAGFITEASRPKIAKACEEALHSLNKPSLVGVVDPADATYVPREDIPVCEAQMVHDVFEQSASFAAKEGVALTKEMLLDTSGEQRLVELRHRAFQAVRNAKIEDLEECMDEGVSVDDRYENGNTLLLLAAQQGLKKIVKFLLRRGAEINDRNLAGNTVLHYCFQYRFNDLAEYLIGKGADDSLLNQDGMTCYEGLNKKALEDD